MQFLQLITISLRLSLVLMLLTTAFVADTVAQRGRGNSDPLFGLSAMAGLNVSQVDGDGFAGFDKFGALGGLRGTINFSPIFKMRLELTYSQKGSRFESTEGIENDKKDRSIRVDYAEVPLSFAFRLNNREVNTAVWVFAGAAFGALVRSGVTDSDTPTDREFPLSSIVDDFNSTEFSLLGGLEVDFNNRFGAGLRYTGAVTKLFDDPEPATVPENVENITFLRNYLLSVYGLYHF